MKIVSNTNWLKGLFILLTFLFFTNKSYAGDAILSWDANSETDLAGYKVYYGTTSGIYPNKLDVAFTSTKTAPSYTITSLSAGQTYYFVVTAYDTSGNESGYSTEVNKLFPIADTIPPVISAISSTNITTSGSNIIWTTNELSNSRIEYGTTIAYGLLSALNTSSTNMVLNHSVSLDGLASSTTYHFRAKSQDASGNMGASADQTFTTLAVNKPPVANAGVDQALTALALITLDGSKSADPDGNPITYSWTQVSGPAVSLLNPKAVITNFTPTVAGIYEFSLVVNDGLVNSIADNVIITIKINKPPVANAGVDQAVYATVEVTIDGSKSSDPDGNPITYIWTQVSGPAVSITNPNTVIEKFTPTVAGIYEFSLVVNDGLVNSVADNVIITVSINNPPTADAGPDQVVISNTLVTLNGINSSDAEKSTLTYQWTQTVGSAVTLSGNTLPKPTFTPVTSGVITFSLVVFDGMNYSTPDFVNVTVNKPNQVPIANAGIDQIVTIGGATGILQVKLVGTGSSDPDGTLLSYRWTQIQGQTVTLSDITSPTPVFTPTLAGVYTFRLVVSDGVDSSLPDDVSITVNATNNVPIADAGINQIVVTGQQVTLNGTLSSDRDGDKLTYKWRQTKGTIVKIMNPNTATPYYTPANNITCIFELVVNDGKVDSLPDSVKIYVTDRIYTRQKVSTNSDSESVLSVDEGDLKGASVTIPANEFNDDTEIVIGQQDEPVRVNLNGMIISNPVVELEPSPINFTKPITLSLPYYGKDINKAKIFYYNEGIGEWEEVSDISNDGKNIIAKIDHFSLFAIGEDSNSLNNQHQEISDNTDNQNNGKGFGCGYIRNINNNGGNGGNSNMNGFMNLILLLTPILIFGKRLVRTI